MAQNTTTPAHCPGFQQNRDLSAYTCKCPACGAEKEIFSDEFNRPHTCTGCGKPIDFTQCTLEGSTSASDPR